MTTYDQNRGRIANSVRDLYDTSSDNAKKWIRWIEVLAVCFTLPHNFIAFAGIPDGLTFWTFSNLIFSGIGVGTLEASLLFALLHLTHGYVANQRHKRIAQTILTIMTTIMIFNAITSHAVLFNKIGPIISLYRDYLLPSTPILALVMSGLLAANHPKIISIGKSLLHLNKLEIMARKAEEKEETARQTVRDREIERREQKMLNDADIEQIGHDMILESQRLEAEEAADELRFQISERRKMRETRLNAQAEAFNSENFQQRVRLAELANIQRILNEQFPDIDTDDLVTNEVHQSEMAEIRRLADQVDELKRLLEASADMAEMAKSDRDQLQIELDATKDLLAQAQEELANRPQQPAAYANGHAAD